MRTMIFLKKSFVSINDVLHIVGNKSRVDLFGLHAGQRIGNIRRIG